MGEQLTIISEMSQHDRRRLIAEELLKAIRINLATLKFKGQGTYNTVFEGPHPNPTVNPGRVALRVASGPQRQIESEAYSSFELEQMRPKDWEKYQDQFQAFAKALCVPEADVDPKYVKQAKYYKKYLNIPEIYAEFSERDVRSILEAKYKSVPEEERAEILDILWEHDPREPKVAYIFIAPLAQGEMWDLFKETAEDGVELKKRIEHIRKAANGVLKALVALHAKGRLHLDIKPDNMLRCVNDKGKTFVQLCDFGLLDFKTQPNNDKIVELGKIDKQGFADAYVRKPSPVGSPTRPSSARVRWKCTDWYKAPEQTRQKPLGLEQLTKIDIYALGASLIFMYDAAKTNIEKAGIKSGDYSSELLANLNRYIDDVDKDIRTAALPEVRKAEYELLDLIRCMTCDDPDDRPSASECLKHRFVKMKLGT